MPQEKVENDAWLSLYQVLTALEEMPPRTAYRSWLPKAPLPHSAAIFVLRGDPDGDPPYVVLIADTNNRYRQPEINGGPLPTSDTLRKMLRDAQRKFGRLRFIQLPGEPPGMEEMMEWARRKYDAERQG